jgi:hypothetical protein
MHAAERAGSAVARSLPSWQRDTSGSDRSSVADGTAHADRLSRVQVQDEDLRPWHECVRQLGSRRPKPAAGLHAIHG